jgi:NAD(P)-dependent dehydrogenase (short-subunit alcohol dehydrogenase family)
MKLGIDDKIALVTGGSKNIGRAIANTLASEGVRLIIAARETAEIKNEIQSKDKRHLFFNVDLMAVNGPRALIQFILDNDCWPDIVVHNLGGSLNVRETFSDISEWEKVWRYNLGIGHELNCSLLPKMIANRWGRVVHLSTLATETFDGNAAYLTAKCGLEGYVKRVSKEVSRHNVIMNAVAPGLVDIKDRYFSQKAQSEPEFIEYYYDNHLPIRRMCQPAEVANLVAFMCSEHSAYMPGAVVRIDGGGY